MPTDKNISTPAGPLLLAPRHGAALHDPGQPFWGAAAVPFGCSLLALTNITCWSGGGISGGGWTDVARNMPSPLLVLFLISFVMLPPSIRRGKWKVCLLTEGCFMPRSLSCMSQHV